MSAPFAAPYVVAAPYGAAPYGAAPYGAAPYGAAPGLASSIGSDLYSGAAMYGRFRAVTGAVIAVVIALIIIVIGVYELRDKHTGAALMTVESVASCQLVPGGTTNGQQNPPQYHCNVGVGFVPAEGGAAVHVGSVGVKSDVPLVVGDTVALRYDPAAPSSVVQELPPRLLGWGLIGGGLLVGATGVGLAVLTWKSRSFAAVEGAVGIAQQL